MKVNIFVSAVSGLFLKLIYHGAGTVVHLLLLKLVSMLYLVTNVPVAVRFQEDPGQLPAAHGSCDVKCCVTILEKNNVLNCFASKKHLNKILHNQ